MVAELDTRKAGISHSEGNVAQGKLLGLGIPLPPRQVQGALVRELEFLLTLTAAIDRSTSVALGGASKLRTGF